MMLLSSGNYSTKALKVIWIKTVIYDEFIKSIHALSANEIYICEHAKKMMINFLSNEQEKQSPNIKEPLQKEKWKS